MGGLYSYNGNCYIYKSQKVTQSQAAYTCSTFNATLMNVQSEDDIQFAFKSEIWVN